MHLLSFALMLVAFVVFAVDYYRTKGLISLGLALMDLGLLLHFIIVAHDNLVTWTLS